MKIPCKQCPVLAICKHKRYESLVTSCVNIYDYLVEYGYDYDKRRAYVARVLNPIKWRIGKKGIEHD